MATTLSDFTSFNCISVEANSKLYDTASRLQRFVVSLDISLTKKTPSLKLEQYKSLSSSMAFALRFRVLLLSLNATFFKTVTQFAKSSSFCVFNVNVPVFVTIFIKFSVGSCVIFTQFSNVIIFEFFVSSFESHISSLSMPWRLERNKRQYLRFGDF